MHFVYPKIHWICDTNFMAPVTNLLHLPSAQLM